VDKRLLKILDFIEEIEKLKHIKRIRLEPLKQKPTKLIK